MARKGSLAEQLAKLLNPAPQSVDPEDVDVDAARTEDAGDDAESSFLGADGRLPLRTEVDLGEKYAGKKVSRKTALDIEEEEEEGEDSSEEVNKKKQKAPTKQTRKVESDDEEEEMSGGREESDDEAEEESSSGSEADGDDAFQSHMFAHSLQEARKLEAELEAAQQPATISNQGETSSSKMQQAHHAKAQRGLFESLLNLRIRLQKPLTTVNRFPQTEAHKLLCAEDPQVKQRFETASTSLRSLLGDLLEFQEELFAQNPLFESTQTKRGVKRPLEATDSLWSACETRQNAVLPVVNDTIAQWNSKALLAAGTVSNTQFKALNQGPLAQIQHVLNDKERLIARAHTLRQPIKVLGKLISASPNQDDGPAEKKAKKAAIVDEEIFDDSDFYQQLLKDLVETSSSKSNDPLAMTRSWFEANKDKVKLHKDVDRKASKGRKIRYKAHEKLVNFMSPVSREVPPMVDELFTTLFQD